MSQEALNTPNHSLLNMENDEECEEIKESNCTVSGLHAGIDISLIEWALLHELSSYFITTIYDYILYTYLCHYFLHFSALKQMLYMYFFFCFLKLF